MAEQAAADGRPRDHEDAVRSDSIAYLAARIEDAGIWLRTWYPMVAHTSDFLVQVGKFAPSKDKAKGTCPSTILRVTTTCRGAGSAMSNAALCLKGAAGVCNLLASGLKCVNHVDGVRAGLDSASRPTLVKITTLPQLNKVLAHSRSTGSPILLDVGDEVTIAFAHKIYRALHALGEDQVNLIKDSPNMKARLAQRARLMALFRQHPLPAGLTNMLSSDEDPAAPNALHRQQVASGTE